MRTSQGIDKIETALRNGETARDVLVERGTGYIASFEILRAGLTSYAVRVYRNVDGEEVEGFAPLPFAHTPEATAIALGRALNEVEVQIAREVLERNLEEREERQAKRAAKNKPQYRPSVATFEARQNAQATPAENAQGTSQGLSGSNYNYREQLAAYVEAIRSQLAQNPATAEQSQRQQEQSGEAARNARREALIQEFLTSDETFCSPKSAQTCPQCRRDAEAYADEKLNGEANQFLSLDLDNEDDDDEDDYEDDYEDDEDEDDVCPVCGEQDCLFFTANR